MKILIFVLGFGICLLWSLSGAAEPTDTFLPGVAKSSPVKPGNTHPAKSNGESSRDSRQATKESKKPHSEGDICLYGPRDIPQVMNQAARTSVARSWP